MARLVGLGAYRVPDGAVDTLSKVPCGIRLEQMFPMKVSNTIRCTGVTCVQQRKRRGGFPGDWVWRDLSRLSMCRICNPWPQILFEAYRNGFKAGWPTVLGCPWSSNHWRDGLTWRESRGGVCNQPHFDPTSAYYVAVTRWIGGVLFRASRAASA